jgi:prohibitin 2
MASLRRYIPGDEILLRFVLMFLMGVMLLAYYSPNIIQNVPSGHAGVLWSRFFGGTVTDRRYGEGIHLIFPWDKMYLYDVRTQHLTDTFEAVTLDGLSVNITLDVRYHILPSMVGLLHRYVGENFRATLIDPSIGAHTRTQVSRFTAEEVYSSQRLFIEREILNQVRSRHGVQVADLQQPLVFLYYDSVLVHGVDLPPRFRDAIENKITQQQVLQEWAFRVERERLESERRLIEAEATRSIVALFPERLTETYLRLRAVEALQSLAASPNAKIVVTGPNAPAMPVVIGADGLGGAAAAAAPGATPSPSAPTVVPPTPRTNPLTAPAPTTTAPGILPTPVAPPTPAPAPAIPRPSP